ncbi:unnamed protein product [Polarella glacialis]|uniref:ABC1 atypical kinase-like domain-containing protein n=1 Tax=Polarella glacialis TaxID=89957 RepID=A0A813JLG4_POLGL|nr:unnamed protein product [Polarella glacialis]
MVLAAPVGIGSLLVVLLSLRRGRQAWAEELPMVYDGPWIEAYWQRRPLRLLLRFIDVSLRAGSFSVAMEVDKWTNKTEEMTPQRAREAKELITDLGPAFVKLVQVWASRPDILPEAYQKEFEQLLERVRPFGKEEALQSLSRNFGGEDKVRSMFDDMAAFDKPVASASIGQVYKASIKGREVAVKVQRPDVREQVTLDLYVIRRLAAAGQYLPIERYASQFKGLFELIDRAAPPFIEELDYELEANNQRRFGDLMSNCDLVADTVVVPEVVLARREVLVQEWLAGVKLTEPGAAKDQAERVVKVLLNSYMVQLMETGFLHGDPHPGNFVLMPSGKIGILDYGLMTTISENKRVALIEYIMHVQAKMFDECLTDLVNLDFLPAGIASDKQAKEIIVPRLANTLTILFEQSDLRVQREKFIKSREELQSTGKLEKLQEELTAIAQKYGSFRLPGYATLIIRCLATLEGVGMKATSKFSLASETFPYIARRLLTDDSLRIREALRAYLYKGRSRISAKRVDDLASGFKSFTNLMKGSRSSAADSGAPRQWETSALDLEIVGAAPQLDQASQDIAKVIFSPDGNFLQELLIDEGVAAIDALSRASLVQLARTLGPLSFPIMAPLSLFLGGGAESRLLSREDKEALLLIRRIVQLVQPGPSADSPSEAAAMTSEDVGRTFEDLQKLGPLAAGLLPAITPGAAAFAQRFAQQLASRALSRVASDIALREGLVVDSAQKRKRDPAEEELPSLDGRNLRLEFVLGAGLDSARDAAQVLGRCCPAYDIVVIGWGTLSSIPRLPDLSAEALLAELSQIARVVMNVVSTTNNHVKFQRQFQARRRALTEISDPKARAWLERKIGLATFPGSYYYRVDTGQQMFYAAITADEEAARLTAAGFRNPRIQICNIINFFDIQTKPKAARINAAVIRLLEGFGLRKNTEHWHAGCERTDFANRSSGITGHVRRAGPISRQMNSDVQYFVANALPGHSEHPRSFWGDWFEVYSPAIRSRYAEVFWKVLEPVPLPADVVERYKGSTSSMAVTGFEVDVVRRGVGGDVSVPCTESYNHHYTANLVSSAADLLPGRAGADMGHGPGLLFRSRPKLNLESGAAIGKGDIPPLVQSFNEHNGNEARQTYHGYPEGLVQPIFRPDRFIFSPMQINTRNPDGSGRVGGPLPRASQAPREGNVSYSGLVECPCTSRTVKGQGTIDGQPFHADCKGPPLSDLLSQQNPTCEVDTYMGGISCCQDGTILLDAEQEVPEAVDEVYFKWRFYYEDYQPPQHISTIHLEWALNGCDSGGPQSNPMNCRHIEYDVPRAPLGTEPSDAVYTISSTWRVRDMLHPCIPSTDPYCADPRQAQAGIQLVMAGGHCHSPACLSLELRNADTGELLCSVQPMSGRSSSAKDERSYIWLPPCQWSFANEGLHKPPLLSLDTNLTSIKRASSTFAHPGVMAIWQMRAIYAGKSAEGTSLVPSVDQDLEQDDLNI